jgi:orotate phosphoribosyltransferase
VAVSDPKPPPVTATLNPPALDTHLGDQWALAELLARPGVVEHGHFRLLSGAHSEHFVRFSRIASDTDALAGVAAALAPTAAVWQPGCVLAPCTAGVSLARELARQLGLDLHLASVDAAGRADGVIGEPPRAGSRALLVNDIVTTGAGLEALAAVARAAGADVTGAAWFASRSAVDVAAALGVPAAWLLSVNLPATPPEACPGCSAGEELVDGLDLN